MRFFASAAAPLDPEHGILVFIFQQESQLYVEFLRTSDKTKNLFRFGCQVFQLGSDARQSLPKSKEFIAIFFQELTAIFKRKPAIAFRQQRKEKSRSFPQALNRSRERGCVRPVSLQRSFYIAAKFFQAGRADSDPEVTAGNILELVRFIEDDNLRIRQDSSVGRTFRLLFDSEVGKKQMMVDDDNVALGCAAAHPGDEAFVP